MTPIKRVFDILLALILMVILTVPFIVIVFLLVARDGFPIFYVAERMKAPDQPFKLWKLRTMTVAGADFGVSGGDKSARITANGRLLRRTRLDEIPQLWNILIGDMSFVGPRPPLRVYVERFPQIYQQVLKSRPGVTGIASLHFHKHEDWLLAQCLTAEETDSVYSRRCVPRKAQLDLLYQRHQSICLDILLLWKTMTRVVFRRSA